LTRGGFEQVGDQWVYTRANGLPQSPPAGPLTRALGKLKTREEKELFLRQWIFNEGTADLAFEQGTAAHRLHTLFKLTMDDAADIDPILRQEARDLPKKMSLPWQEARWNREAAELKQYLRDEGIDLIDMLRRPSNRVGKGQNGQPFVPFMDMGKDGKGGWKFVGEGKGDPVFLEESIVAELQRMQAHGGAKNPEVAAAIQAWDGFTNLLKLGLTSIGGFPSFQVRNLYSNAAFGLTGAHLHLLSSGNWQRIMQQTFINPNPNMAVTKAGYEGALRGAVLNDLAVAAGTSGTRVTQMDAADAVYRMYRQGSGRKAERAQRIAREPKRLQKEAARLREELNTVMLVTDDAHEITVADFLYQVKKQNVEIDPRILAEFTGNVETFYSRTAKGKFQQARDAARDKILRMNTFFEQWSRQQVFAAYLKRGLGFEEAGRQAKKWLLDYSALSPIEKNVMKRFIPFYTFYRRALPLMMESVVTRPGISSIQAKIFNPRRPELSYVDEMGSSIQWDTDDNLKATLGGIELPLTSTLRLLDAFQIPVAAVTGDIKQSEAGWKGLTELASMLHPLATGGFEAATGYNLYFQEKRDRIKANAVGAALDKMGYGEGSLWEKRVSPGTGKTNYYIDNNLTMRLANGILIGRLLSAADSLYDTKIELDKDETRGLLRHLSGLRYEEWTTSQVNEKKTQRIIDMLMEHARRKGYVEVFEMEQLKQPEYRPRKNVEARRKRAFHGIED
jgi:hypothetical protein